MGIRSATPYSPSMGSTTQFETPASGNTIVVLQTQANTIFVIIQPAGLLAALNIQLPATGAFNGQSINIALTQPVTLLSFVNAPVLGALTSIAANGFARYTWSAPNNQWYRTG